MCAFVFFFYLLRFAFVPFFGLAKSRRTGGKIFDCYVNVVAVAKGGRSDFFLYRRHIANANFRYAACCRSEGFQISYV